MGTAPKKSRCDGAASAQLNRRGSELGAVDLANRRDRPHDDVNAERWVYEGGSFTCAGGEMAGPPLITPPEEPAPPGRGPSYSCPECGHVLRVSGLGRHQLYFDRPNTLVMDGVCPVCHHGLPGKNGL